LEESVQVKSSVVFSFFDIYMKNCQILTGELSHEDDKTLTLMKYSTDTKIVGSQQR